MLISNTVQELVYQIFTSLWILLSNICKGLYKYCCLILAKCFSVVFQKNFREGEFLYQFILLSSSAKKFLVNKQTGFIIFYLVKAEPSMSTSTNAFQSTTFKLFSLYVIPLHNEFQWLPFQLLQRSYARFFHFWS